MDSKVIAAFIGVFGTLTGVLLGWWLQRVTATTSRKAEYREFVLYSEKLVKELLFIIDDGFSTYESLSVVAGPPYRTVFPKNMKKEFKDLHERSRTLDASMAIYLMWLNQAINNLSEAILMLHDDVKERKENNLSPISEKSTSINVVIGKARKVKEYAYCLWYLSLKKKTFLHAIRATVSSKYKELRKVYERYEKEYSYNKTIKPTR